MATEVAVGFIGAGAVAHRHARTLLGFEDVRIAAVAEPLGPAAQSLARLAGARVHASAEAMLEAERLDAVYVCVPPFAHGEPERLVIDAGLPLFVEKPLAVDLPTAEAIAAAVRRTGLVTATGYHWRYLDVVERAKEALERRPARLAIGAWLDKVPPPSWWIDRARSGGQTIEQTTHVLDLLLELMGDVEDVFAVSSRTERPAFPHSDVDDVSSATLRFVSGAIGSVVSTCLLQGKHRAGVELFGDGMTMTISESELVVDDGDGPRRHLDDGRAKIRVDRDFIDAVRGDGDGIRAPYETALRTHRLACALVRSAEQQTAVRMADV